MNQLTKELGSRIKKHRKARGLTIEQLSARLHKSKSTVSKYENGSISIDVQTLFEIAKILEIDMSSLLSLQTKEKTPISLPKDHYFAKGNAFVYYYDGRFGDLIKSYISMTQQEDKISVLFYNDVKNFEETDSAQYIYQGTFIPYDTISYLSLSNQVNHIQKMSISILNPVMPNVPAVGLISAVGSSPFFAPVGIKAIFSNVPLQEDSTLYDYLIFSKEELKSSRHYNMMVVNRPTGK